MKALILIAALAAAAGAAPGYPVKLAPVSQAERARRKAAFEQREPAWRDVVVNSRGFIVHLSTDDPAFPATLNGVYLAPVLDLLRREADSFGIDPADLGGALERRGTCSEQLQHERDGALLGWINVRCDAVAGHVAVVIDLVPWLDVTPKLTADDVTKRVLGGRYAITSTGTLPALRDCGMGGTGRQCAPRAETRHDVVTFGLDDLASAVESTVFRDGNALRLVYCVDATWNAPDPNTVVRPLAGAKRLPFVVDAVTGAELSLHVPSCAAIPSID